MSLLAATGLSRYVGGEPLFRGVDLRLARGDRAGLVGPNGCGKSTLLRALAGLAEADAGKVVVARGARVAFLPQEAGAFGETVASVVAGARARVDALAAELRALETRHADPAALARYGEVLAAFEHAGGYEFDARARQVLGGLGLGAVDPGRSLASLSGGERTRLALVRLLLEDPDVLLLDEPTNHLDVAALEWLERELVERERTALIASHDRYFLDRVTARTLAFVDGTVRAYRGGYSAYARERAEELERQARSFERQREEIARQEAFIERERAGQRARPPGSDADAAAWLGARASRLEKRHPRWGGGQARGRQKQLARLARVAAPERHVSLSWRLPAAPLGSAWVLESTPLVAGYERERPILRVPALRIERAARVAVVGPNGSGKTTLLRTLLGEIPALEGHVRAAPGARVAVRPQSASDVGADGTVLESFRAATGWREQEARDLLARFLFCGEDVFRDVAVLSGGERARLGLALLAAREANLLVLDEPTNHLDLPSREALEEVLTTYEGALLLVSHDRALIDRLATHLWLVDAGTLRMFEGNYTAMRQTLQRETAEHRAAAGAGSPAGERMRPPRGGDHRLAAGQGVSAARARRRATDAGGQGGKVGGGRPGAAAPLAGKEGRSARRREDRRLEELEQRIASLERRLDELARLVAEVAQAGNFLESRRAGEEYAEVERALRDMYDEWAKAAE